MSVIAVITDQKGRPVCSNGKYYCQVNLGDGNIINKFIDKSFLVTEGEGKDAELKEEKSDLQTKGTILCVLIAK
ncbi:uncharacterized protein LOC127279584 isoform X4 [Leptopilina boulardi]|uniref:uncharacterized protein LOC127279584 isoform X4 n=1 Tax=Leptopilina boulardi TaxID=63433 RepID=UPI0021F5D22B|nr:uncharacterized protein LOC127279584 isoform X4 [Leptopilina boulardi]